MRFAIKMFSAFLCVTAASSALGQYTMPPDVQKYFYCSEVAFVLSVEAADATEKAKYLAMSDRLAKAAQARLVASGWEPFAATNVTDIYADEVEDAWFGSGTLRFSVPDCMAIPEALRP